MNSKQTGEMQTKIQDKTSKDTHAAVLLLCAIIFSSRSVGCGPLLSRSLPFLDSLDGGRCWSGNSTCILQAQRTPAKSANHQDGRTKARGDLSEVQMSI